MSTSRRFIRINGLDKTIEITKANMIKSERDKSFLYLESLKDGTFRLTYTENLIPDFSKVESLEIIRHE